MTLNTIEIYFLTGLAVMWVASFIILTAKFWDEGMSLMEVIALRMFVFCTGAVITFAIIKMFLTLN
jgi:hypothetical protein